MTDTRPALSCPVCSEALLNETDGKQLICANKHSFDRAKQGYFNLLLNQDKKSKSPGDTSEMVKARTEFLKLGHYQPILDRIHQLVRQHLTFSEHVHYCDIACGEGYYTEQVRETLNHQTHCVTTGLDISMPAVKAAARQYSNTTWLVANAFRLPLESTSQQLVSHLFSRPCMSEAERILSAEGLLIEVSSGTTHLVELRKALYGELKDKTESASASGVEQNGNLIKLASEQLEFAFELKQADDIANLIMMTPHAWRASKEAQQGVIMQEQLTLSADVRIDLYRKSV